MEPDHRVKGLEPGDGWDLAAGARKSLSARVDRGRGKEVVWDVARAWVLAGEPDRAEKAASAGDKETNNKPIKGGTTMPRGDGTGPMGMGPMTGRAAGFCAGYNMPGYMNPVFGRGFGMGRGGGWGRGGGRGWRRQFYATGLPGWARFGGYPYYMPEITPEQERMALKAQADALRSEMEAITKRLAELETEEKKGK